MIGPLHIPTKTPCLIAVLDDIGEPDLVMVEPLKFIPVRVVYAKGRQSGFGVKINNSRLFHSSGIAHA